MQEKEAFKEIREQKLAADPECEIRLPGCNVIATQVHHSKGRGIYYHDINYLKSACDFCHDFVESNPMIARHIGASYSRLSNNDNMGLFLYTLDRKTPVRCESSKEWREWFETTNRQVHLTLIKDRICVSSVFLGIDNALHEIPLLFEVAIFGGIHNGWCVRCATWDETMKEHRRAVAMAKSQFESK